MLFDYLFQDPQAAVSLISLVPSMAGMLIASGLAIYLTREYRAERKESDAKWQNFINTMITGWQAALAERDEGWQGFLQTQGERREDAMQVGMKGLEAQANTVSSLSGNIADLSKVMAQHETCAKGRTGDLLHVMERIDQNVIEVAKYTRGDADAIRR